MLNFDILRLFKSSKMLQVIKGNLLRRRWEQGFKREKQRPFCLGDETPEVKGDNVVLLQLDGFTQREQDREPRKHP
jgi:hypothetical protein